MPACRSAYSSARFRDLDGDNSERVQVAGGATLSIRLSTGRCQATALMATTTATTVMIIALYAVCARVDSSVASFVLPVRAYDRR